MGYDFGNNYQDGHRASSYEYKPSWEKTVDYNPDHRPADGGLWVETCERGVIEVVAVRGFGALVLRAAYDLDDKLEFKGVSEFSDQEIGWRK